MKETRVTDRPVLTPKRHCPICWQRKSLDCFEGDKRRCIDCDDKARKRAESKDVPAAP